MRIHLSTFVLALGTLAPAQGFLQISIGVRETGFAGSLVGTIGADGGVSGGIEFVAQDTQVLPLDGQWHTFTFDFANDPITGFAGASANNVLEGAYGVLEHIRVLNSSGETAPITLLIDDVTNTTTTGGPVNFGDFESYAAGSLVMFRQAGFSGSTSANVMTGSTAAVQNTFPSGVQSYQLDFQFVDNLATRWARVTTFNTTNLPNPVVRFDDNSVLTFRVLGYTGFQPDLGFQGPGNVTGVCAGSGLNAGEASTVHFTGAPPGTIGAIGVSIYGLPDLPILGGTVASGTGLLFSIPLFADANGQASLTIHGDATMVDFALQGVFLDTSLPQGIAFSNAFQAQFGQ